MKPIVSVIGLGYVGLPLCLAISSAGILVRGIDVDSTKIDRVNAGISDIGDVENSEIKKQISNQTFSAFTSFSALKDSNIIIVCVPTPLKEDRTPDYSFVKHAAESIAPWLKKGDLVVLESTVAPGFTREIFLPILEAISGLNHRDFYLAYSPERVDPGNLTWRLKNTPKIVAGLNEISLQKSSQFYSEFVDTVVTCDSLEIAEMAKILENSFRFINISFINEVNILTNKLKIDLRKVIDAAKTKPYGFMEFYPSLGAGGHCIPVDPKFLSQIATRVKSPLKFLDLAEEINLGLPTVFVNYLENQIGSLVRKSILVIGIAYKPNVADVRESPALALILELRRKQASVSWHDDYVKNWNSEQSVPILPNYDLAIIATHHEHLDLNKLRDTPTFYATQLI